MIGTNMDYFGTIQNWREKMRKVTYWPGGTTMSQFKPTTNMMIIFCLSAVYVFLKWQMPENTDAGVVLGALIGFIKSE
jgi:hypothetical protein